MITPMRCIFVDAKRDLCVTKEQQSVGRVRVNLVRDSSVMELSTSSRRAALKCYYTI